MEKWLLGRKKEKNTSKASVQAFLNKILKLILPICAKMFW